MTHTPAFPLRPYQREALDAIAAADTNGVRRPLVVAPTGAGKTVMFSHAIAERGGRALVLAHREELIQQAAGKIAAVMPALDVGIVKANRAEVGADVVVGSIQTLARPNRLAALLDNPINRRTPFSTVIVDEAHHAAASTYLEVLAGLGCMADDGAGPLCVGFTATAGRADRIGLGYVWQDIVYRRGILQMIAEGYLVDVSAVQVGADLDLSKVKVRRGDYTDASLGEAIENSDAIAVAAAAYLEHAADRKGLAFTPTVATSQALTRALVDVGIAAEHVDGTTDRDTRRGVLARLHSGETQVVSNCMVLTEGFDEPSVSTILNLRPTKSETLFVQMVGRALRKHPSKVDALVVDVAGAADLGLATIADLAGLPPRRVKPTETLLDAAERIADEDANPAYRPEKTRTVNLFAASRMRWLDVDGAYVLPVSVDQTFMLVPESSEVESWGVYVQRNSGRRTVENTYSGLSLDYAMGIGEELARAANGSIAKAKARWREKPSTTGQRSMLTRLGYGVDLPASLTCGQAADLLTAYYAAHAIGRIRQVRA